MPKIFEIMKNLDLRLIKGMIDDNSLITLSWGIYNPLFSQTEISFFVNGLKFQGQVIIKSFDGDILGITLINETQNITLVATYKDIITELDNIIEYSDNYSSEVIDSIKRSARLNTSHSPK